MASVAIILGSVRPGRAGEQVVRWIEDQVRQLDGVQTVFFDLRDYELPLFAEEMSPSMKAPELAEAVRLRTTIEANDAVLFVTPEYNHSIPGVLKNAIDWLSRVDKVMINKPSLIMGTTPGCLGTVYAQMHLRDILFALQSPVLMGNDTLVGAGHQKLSGTDNLTDDSTIAWLDTVMPNFTAFVASH